VTADRAELRALSADLRLHDQSGPAQAVQVGDGVMVVAEVAGYALHLASCGAADSPASWACAQFLAAAVNALPALMDAADEVQSWRNLSDVITRERDEAREGADNLRADVERERSARIYANRIYGELSDKEIKARTLLERALFGDRADDIDLPTEPLVELVRRVLDEREIRTAERDSAIVANHGVGREREEARAERDRARGATAVLLEENGELLAALKRIENLASEGPSGDEIVAAAARHGIPADVYYDDAAVVIASAVLHRTDPLRADA
jgi:hypothetical protein